MVMHVVSSSPSQSPAILGNSLHTAASSDVIILVGNAVYAALAGTADAELIARARCPVMVLRDDVIARGISNTAPQVELIDYARWVQLSTVHQQSISWYE